MSSHAGYCRYPSIHNDRIIFVNENDLWSVSDSGGVANRITANPGEINRPAISPCGKWIAFTSRDEGQTEVYVISIDGGQATRLTYLGTNSWVLGWSKSGDDIVFISDSQQPFMGLFHLHTIPHTGGTPTKSNIGPVMSASYKPDGDGLVIARNGGGRGAGDPAKWKRYRGGKAGILWIDSTGSGRFRRLIKLDADLANPMWIGKRIYFLSDHEGSANIYSCTVGGKNLKRHTDHTSYYARFPQTDGRRIIYTCGADIYVFDPETNISNVVPIEIHSSRPEINRKYVSAAKYLEAYDIHPEGHSIAVTTRGKVATFPHWEEAVALVGDLQGTRYRFAQWLPENDELVAISDQSGEEELVLLKSGRAPRNINTKTDLGRTCTLQVAPAGGKLVALANHRNELIVANLKTKSTKFIDKSRFGRIESIAWSADAKWLAYTFPTTLQTIGIKIYNVEAGKSRLIATPDFKDDAVAFDPEGNYLFFTSTREFDPVYDRQLFDLGFPRGMRLLAVPLRADIPSPFEATPRAPGAAVNQTSNSDLQESTKDKKSKNDANAPTSVEIDFNGLESRIVSCPIGEGIFGQLYAIPGKILFTSYPIEGSAGQDLSAVGGPPPAKATLDCYDYNDCKRETLVSGVTDFAVAATGKVMAYRAGNQLRVLKAGAKPTQSKAGNSNNSKPSRENGWIDLSRINVSIQPAKEWGQMFKEAWRLQRDQFWTEDMAGLDWKEVYDRYRPLVNRVSTRSEFSDLMWEMQGELGTSHAYEMGGDYYPEPRYPQGLLGADINWDTRTKSWRITRIPKGDSWVSRASSPLAAPGLDLNERDRIVAIGQNKLTKDNSPSDYLVNLAGQKITLTVANASGKEKRDIIIRTIGSEFGLRYRDWVESNRNYVHEATDGTVGYVHVPDMGPAGFAEFHRNYIAELHCPSLIVDVRYNRGGHISPLLLEKLLRRRVGYDLMRWGEPLGYPYDTYLGPIVAITNEHSGSDGDIFSHTFKLSGAGTLIGTRTWGGVIGVWPRHMLVDGTLTTQPEFSFWFNDVGYGVENYGTDPDIEVEIKPQDYAAGNDTQLQRAIHEIKKQIRKSRPQLPNFGPKPQLSKPKLGPAQ